MLKKILIVLFLTISIFSSPLAARPKIQIAVIPFKIISETTDKAVSEKIVSMIAETIQKEGAIVVRVKDKIDT